MRDLNFKAIVIDLEIVALVVAVVVAVVVVVSVVVACVSFSCLRRKLLASVGSLRLAQRAQRATRRRQAYAVAKGKLCYPTHPRKKGAQLTQRLRVASTALPT